MTPDQRLARIARSLEDAGVDALVMGGHAVRYYGVERNTSDFDLVASVASPEELRNCLSGAPGFEHLQEVPVWRQHDFARFVIGTLPDGRQELLEFWIRNHLLPEFSLLRARAEVGVYGGENVTFISLDDLLRSKETEREDDWLDIALLEEIRDARLLAAAVDADGMRNAVGNVRSRRGFDRLRDVGLLNDAALVEQAISQATHPVTFAYLSPLVPQASPAHVSSPIESTALTVLGKAQFNTSPHLGVVEVIRRGYKRHAMERDRLDKQITHGRS